MICPLMINRDCPAKQNCVEEKCAWWVSKRLGRLNGKELNYEGCAVAIIGKNNL